MDTTNRPRTLTATQRNHLRTAIDQAVRQRLTPPAKACPECGTDLSSLKSRATYGCQTCADRLYRRRTRSS
jgi:protein-arginine kinase activator protein McsA